MLPGEAEEAAAREPRVAGGAWWPAGVSVQLMGLAGLRWAFLQTAAEARVCRPSGTWASGTPCGDTGCGCLPVPLRGLGAHRCSAPRR